MKILHESQNTVMRFRLKESGKDNQQNQNDHRMHIALHEAGHAVIACVLWPERLISVKVQYDSESFSGETTTDQPDNSLNANDIENGILIKLGGKAALDLYGIKDIGALIDVQKATNMVNEMISSAATEGFEYLGLENESEQRKQEREQMLNDKLNEYYTKAKQILTEHKPFLDFLAYELSKRGELNGDQVKQIQMVVESRKGSL